MKIRRTLLPGKPGTKKLLTQYGDDLVCVRYRYDPERQEKIRTVEIIIERTPWTPDPAKIPQNKRMQVRVAPDEHRLRSQVKASGGRWNHRKRVWELSYKAVCALSLTDRLVVDDPGQ